MRVFKAFAILLVLISPFLMTGCGGGGGGGGASSPVSAPTNSGTTLSGSSTAKTLIAQSIAGNYSSLQDNAVKYAKRAGSLRSIRPEITSESVGFGKVQVTYGPSDTLTAFGTTYTYTGGRQILSFFDTSNNYTETLELVNTLSIDNQSLAYRFVTGGSTVSAVASGKLAFSGFLSETSFTVQAVDLRLTGLIGSVDTFSWTMNGSVTVDTNSFPYPKNGQQESGTIVYNSNQYNYVTSYDGTNVATCVVTGAENFTFRINLATGVVVSGNQGTTSILGTWKLEQESDDAGGMVPVRPNAAGGVSTVTFNADGTGRSVEYDREYRSEWGYALSSPTVSDTGDFTWSLSGTTLTTRSAYGTFTNTVQVIDGKLHQTLSDGSKAIWGK